ncbi:MAG: hypothetical protein H0X51_05240 [Parachlamydiaceae bacterium]|nr:hypothetical protein [Parachlamydiaceae bacterium]
MEQVRLWFKSLNERLPEVLESLTNEGVYVESAFLDRQGDDLYLIYYLKAKDIAHAYAVFDASDLPIDHYYKECWKNYCEGREVLEELLDIDRIEK